MSASTSSKPRIHFLSPLRIVMFLAVVWNHAEGFARARTADDPIAEVVLSLSPEGRFLFITITAFLIARSASSSSAVKRVIVIAWPFLVWSVLYTGVEVVANGPGVGGVGSVVLSILTGSAAPHLYFVIVTIQLTLLAPLIQFLARLGRRAQAVLVVLAAVAQLAVVALDLVIAPTGFPVGWLCVAYPLWVIGGAVLAANLELATTWFRAHVVHLIVGLAVFGAGYIGIATSTQDPGAFGTDLLLRELRSVWNVLFGLAVVATCMQLVASTGRWSEMAKRAGERMQDLGYGLFLAHELFLHGLATALAPVSGPVPFALLTLVLSVGVVVGTLGFVVVVRRTPLSWSLTGRPMQRRVTRAPALVTRA
ncbi:acyltransferase family protein [Curtobacterium sp. NPDC087082]|uniref:acyltransferase family protein n=1 Tax=Curtobacterium sp. NPDC087082 TaxID=3363966 RepID=UPI003821F632